MNRKFRELIPLFAIGLMIMGAVALLIVMNMDGSKKNKQNVTLNATNTDIEDNTSNSDDESKNKVISEDEEEADVVVKEFGDITTEDASLPVKPINSAQKNKDSKKAEKNTTNTNASSNKTTTSTKNVETVKVNTSTQTSNKVASNATSAKSETYIKNMVDGLISSTPAPKKETTTFETQSQIFADEATKPYQAPTVNVSTNTSTSTNKTVNTVSTQNRNYPKQTLTQSKDQRIKSTAYNIIRTTNVNGYTVAVTSSNNIISYNPSNNVVVSVLNTSPVSIMKTYGNSVYTYEPSSENFKKYDLYNGSLSLVSNVHLGSCANFIVTSPYIYVLKNDARLYAFRLSAGYVEQAQLGFTMESGGIASLNSANGTSVNVTTNSGKTINYTFNGISFNKR